MAASREDAEDLVQQSLLNAYRAWRRFDGRNLRSWLIRILRNEHLSKIKRDSSRPQETALDVEIADAEGSWDRIAWRDEASRILAELERLPPEYALAVQLCDVEEMTYEEAAEAMDVPLGTVKSRVFRGRAMIRNRILGRAAEQEAQT
jgi:RNA polymerase sigma-70 factor (ECF subfamily)